MMAFFRCKKLESIPENLFANNTKINDLSFTFKNCNELTSIPQNIINNAIYIWYFYCMHISIKLQHIRCAIKIIITIKYILSDF